MSSTWTTVRPEGSGGIKYLADDRARGNATHDAQRIRHLASNAYRQVRDTRDRSLFSFDARQCQRMRLYQRSIARIRALASMELAHTLTPAVGTVVVAVIAEISSRQYDHRDAKYAADKHKAGSIRHFCYMYRYLQLTSIAPCGVMRGGCSNYTTVRCWCGWVYSVRLCQLGCLSVLSAHLDSITVRVSTLTCLSG
jgi:hypothetical protein